MNQANQSRSEDHGHRVRRAGVRVKLCDPGQAM